MSTALGIPAVTAVLQKMLYSVFHDPNLSLGAITVTAVAPDIVQSNLGSGGSGQRQINLFLHQVTPNGSWRNMGLPSLGVDGSTRLTNPPLALDLHYLLTSYGATDCEAEALLGLAVQLLHENPVATRSEIQTNLSNLSGLALDPSLANLLGSTGLADQIELIKITPSILGREEMAWLWTALKADYRLTFPFQVSVVLIQAKNPAQAPLPVASRNVAALAGLLPSITSVVPPASQSAARQGDTVTVNGDSLGSATGILLSNAHLGIHHPPITPSQVSASSVQFLVPNDPTGLPAGVYIAYRPGSADRSFQPHQHKQSAAGHFVPNHFRAPGIRRGTCVHADSHLLSARVIQSGSLDGAGNLAGGGDALQRFHQHSRV